MTSLRRAFSRLVVSTQEYFHPPNELDELVDKVGKKLSQSSHPIAFCGAGLSTKSGIPDYRSGYNTVLDTGPGKWESDENKAKYSRTPTIRKGNLAWPNDGHRALSALVKEGFIKFIISQNVDGLLGRAGVPQDKISELHGNNYTELCPCGQTYFRDFVVPNYATKNHYHGRTCHCMKKEPLKDTLIYFGDSLNAKEIERSKQEVAMADFCLVLGSSLQVTPASSFVRHITMHRSADSLALVNLQKTVFHNKGHTEIHTFCDEFLIKLANHLNISLTPSTIKRSLSLTPSPFHPDTHLRFTFFDKHSHEVQATHSITLHESPGISQTLTAPFEIHRDDLKRYHSADFEFIILPGDIHQVNIEFLLSGGVDAFSFSYQHGGGLSFDKHLRSDGHSK